MEASMELLVYWLALDPVEVAERVRAPYSSPI